MLLGPSDDAVPISIKSFKDSSGNVSTDIDNIPHPASWDASFATCVNALKSLKYYVTYNQTSILDVSVEVETIDVAQEAPKVKQSFAIEFVPIEVESSQRSYAKNNLITRTRSGNPGYIHGEPTLGARSHDGNEAASHVIAQKAGFTVMDTGVGGQCSSSSHSGSTVGFAKDVFVGCTQSMTRQTLKEFCTADVHPMLSSRQISSTEQYVFPKWLETNQEFLGIFGNADPLDIRQWARIESALDQPRFAVKSRSWIDAESRCVGMPSRLRFEILWTYVGNVDNPQAKILR